jgi:serine phosphatase RsbU (regulator of sigma subunit)
VRLLEVLQRLHRAVLTALALLFVGVLWALDYVTGPELSPLVFYSVPVVLIVWLVGRGAAILVSAVAAAAWLLADLMTRSASSHPAILWWNAAEKLLFFLLLTQLVATLKAALEREKLARQEFLEREIRIAEQVQERLFPQNPPVLATLDCAGVCRPVRSVGGDYYDFLPLEDGRAGIAVGDVSGKGLSAALLMASLQATLRSFASRPGGGAREVVAETNRQMCALTETTRFVTLFWAVYDERGRELTYVNAGHNYPMLFRESSNGGEPERLASDGPVVGLFPAASWAERRLRLSPGDLLVLFTDGIPEAENARGVEFGEARLAALVAAHRHMPAAALCETILREVASFLGPTSPQDDLTVLVARSLAPREPPGTARR